MGNSQGDALGNLADILEGTQWQARAHEQTPPPNPGDRVMIHGLSIRTDLNGKLALLLDSAAPRFRLRVEDTGVEIKAKRQNFTRIVTAPADVVDVDRDDAGSVDTTTLLRGDCVICLGAKQATRAVVPCGHLATCDDCAPRLLMAPGRCPICRGPVCDIIRIFLPTGSGEGELEKVVERCKAAEKRASDLEARLRTLEKKRARGGAGETLQKQDHAKTDGKDLTPEVGFWIQLPALNGRSAAALSLPSPSDTEYSRQFGEVLVVNASANTCVVRFQGADQKVYAEQGRKQPGTGLLFRDVELPLDFPFQTIQTSTDAIRQEDQYCVFASMKSDRQKHIRAQRRAEQKCAKAEDVS